jgi:RHS repeat-associated protein
VLGNKISQKKKRSSIEEDNGRLDYQYDALNRLKCVVQGGNILREYEYDAFGNRIKKIEYIEGQEEQTSYTYNERNQLLTESTDGKVVQYSYDRRGNLTKLKSGDEVSKQFTFDAANQMTKTIETQGSMRKSVVFEYNGLGYRTSQEINCLTENNAETPQKRIEYITDMTRQYHNLLQMTTWDYQNAEPVYQKFIWDRNVVGLEKDRSKNFYLLDDLGSPMELLEEDGRIAESYAYDEFGASIYRTKDIFKNSLQPFGFTGYQMDETDGLYFAQTRRYDAGTGRFVSEDFMKGILEAPFTLNNYTYCWNNPLGLVDLNGMWPEFMETAGKWIGEHKEDIAKVAITTVAVAAAVGVTAVTFGTASGVMVAAFAGVGAISGGALSSINGTDMVDGIVKGGLSGTLIGMSMAVNAVGGFCGGAAQLVSDIINGKASPVESYVGAFVGGAIGNSMCSSFLGGAIGTAVGESLERVDGGKHKSLLEITYDSLVLGGVSKGLNFVSHTAITFDAYYWMKIILNKETENVIEAGLVGASSNVYNSIKETMEEKKGKCQDK